MVLSNKEWLDKMDEIITAIQNNGVDSQVIMDMLSNMWISSVTYNVGDYVLYNNNIWKCLVQNSNIAPTEGSTWTSVKITDEISTLNSNFSESLCKTYTHNVTLSDGSFNLSYDVSNWFSKINNVFVTEYGGYNVFGCGIVDDSLSNYTIGIKCITNPSSNSNYNLKVTYIGEPK